MDKLKNSIFAHYVHIFFEFGVFIKGFNGFFEVVVGTLVLFIDKVRLTTLFYTFAQGELLDDPHDPLINFIAGMLQNLSTGTKMFAASYILLHGILNIFLAIQLYRNRIWAYRVMLGILVLAVFYQTYRIYVHHSITLTVITVFDIIFIWLTTYEYRYQEQAIKDKAKISVPN